MKMIGTYTPIYLEPEREEKKKEVLFPSTDKKTFFLHTCFHISSVPLRSNKEDTETPLLERALPSELFGQESFPTVRFVL